MLVLPNSLKMVDALTSSNARENLTFFALPVPGDHKRNGLTDRLAGRVAEDALSTFVPACNDAIEIFAYNRIVAGLDYGGQPAQSLLAFAKRNFDLYPFRNIAIGFEHQAVIEQLHTALDDNFAAIFADMM